MTSSYNDGRVINVILLDFEQNGTEYSHYVLITSSSTFFYKQYRSAITGQISSAKTLFCFKCYDHFRSDNKFQAHIQTCTGDKNSVVKIFPKPEDNLAFKNHKVGFKRIFCGYVVSSSIFVFF